MYVEPTTALLPVCVPALSVATAVALAASVPTGIGVCVDSTAGVVGVESIDGLRILGKPHLSIAAFGSDEIDVFRVAEVMSEKGWLPGLVQEPRAIHRMMSMIHADSKDEYLSDLRAAVGVVRQAQPKGAAITATY